MDVIADACDRNDERATVAAAAHLGRAAACRAALSDPATRRIVLSFMLFGLIDTTTWTASLVYAYQTAGAGGVGVVGFALLVPGILIAPVASFCGDRFHRVHVLVGTYGLVSVWCAATAVLIALDSNRVLVFTALAGATTAITFPRPAMGALLPSTVGSGDRLTASNIVLGAAQSLSYVVGPAMAGLILAAGGVVPVFWFAAALAVVSAAVVAPVPLRRAPLTDDERLNVGAIHAEVLAGFRALRSSSATAAIILMMGVQALMLGFLDVTAVVFALDVLGRDDVVAGWFVASLGVGAIVGAGVSTVLLGRRRVTPTLLVAVALTAVPLPVLAVTTRDASAIVVLVVCGAGLALSEVAGQRLLQWVTPDEVLARVYGCLEGIQMASLALGSLLCSLLFDALRPAAVVVIAACAVVLALAVIAPTLLRLDRQRVPPDPELIELLRTTHFLAPLPEASLERLSASLARTEPRKGQRVVQSGMRCTTLFIVATGFVYVTRQGEMIRSIGPAEELGGLAILDDVVPNMDAIAGAGVVLYEMDATTLRSLTASHPRSEQRLRRVADHRRL